MEIPASWASCSKKFLSV